MSRRLSGGVFALALVCLVGGNNPAMAAAPYELDPLHSLTGDCSVASIDPVPDPICPTTTPGGRFDEPRSVAIDAYGNEFVASYDNRESEGRIDIFDDEGRFISELADPQGPTSVAVDTNGYLYVVEEKVGLFETARYTPSAGYDPEAGDIAYDPSSRMVIASDPGSLSVQVAVDLTTDHVFLTYGGNKIREYGEAPANELLHTVTEDLAAAGALAIDGERRRLYATTCKELGVFKCVVAVFNADFPYAPIDEIEGPPGGEFVSTKGWLGLATDESTGDLFVGDLETSKNVYQFDEAFNLVAKLTVGAFQGGRPLQLAVSNSPLDPEAANRHQLFVPVPPPENRVLAFSPPGSGPPEVKGVFATSIGEREAELHATVDPDGAVTEYFFEYQTQQAYEEEGGFGTPRIVQTGVIPAASLGKDVSAVVHDLMPGTAYRFRVRAVNAQGDSEVEAGFITYADAPLGNVPCENDGLREGASAVLPDCRAYEIVTPPDTGGHNPKGLPFSGDRFDTLEASPQGEAVSFLVDGGAIPGIDATGSFNGDPYRAQRTPGGWTTSLVGPSGTETPTVRPGSVSPDQGFEFWDNAGEGALARGRYVRYPDGHSEIVGRGSLATDPDARGVLITEHGTHIVFHTEQSPPSEIAQQLEPNAPPTGTEAVYDRTPDEVTHVVSLLPDDQPPSAGEDAEYRGASPDGNGIAFEVGSTLYVRVGNIRTFEVGTDVTFAGVSESGRRVFFVDGGDLYAYDTVLEEEIRFTQVGNATVVNVAPGGTRAYFVSSSVIPDAEESPSGWNPQAGNPNLYLSEEGEIRFVGTLTARDVEGELDEFGTYRDGLGLWTSALVARELSKDPSRLTPDGRVLLFQSRAVLTEQPTGGWAQIYRYDSAANTLQCLSCIPTGVPEGGGASLQSSHNNEDVPLSDSGFVPNIRADGSRAFFQSTEALVSRDTDQVQDVYEWEEGGVGSCTRPDGCVYLISSGQSERDNYLYGHSSGGDDVFFISGDALVGSDAAGGTPSIYDARVGGGFPEPAAVDCSGEGCRPGVPPAPALAAPARPAVGARDNVARRCPKSKRKVRRHGKIRCVKKKRRHHHRRHNAAKKGAGR